VRTDNPYRPPRLSATFEDWIVRDIENPITKEIKGQFRVEIRLIKSGRRSVFRAMLGDTLQKFGIPFAQSKLDECKSYVECQFKRKVKDWEEIA
jgi:hypothetical protein